MFTRHRTMAHPLLLSLEKLDVRATEKQGGRELRAFLLDQGEASLGELVPHVLKNLKRSLGAVATAECVNLLGESTEAHPRAMMAYLSKVVAAIVRQLSRPDARCRESCCQALGIMAEAVAQEDVIEGPIFGTTGGLRLAPFFCPLFAALAEPGRELQEGAAAAVRAVLLQATAPDVASSLPVLLPKLLRLIGSGTAPAAYAMLGALEASLMAAEPELHLANALPIAQCLTRCLAAHEFRTRSAAAKCAVPLLGTIAPSLSEGSPSVEAAAVVRVALESVRYDRYAQVREASQLALRELPQVSASPAPVAGTPGSVGSAKRALRAGRPRQPSSAVTPREGAAVAPDGNSTMPSPMLVIASPPAGQPVKVTGTPLSSTMAQQSESTGAESSNAVKEPPPSEAPPSRDDVSHPLSPYMGSARRMSGDNPVGSRGKGALDASSKRTSAEPLDKENPFVVRTFSAETQAGGRAGRAAITDGMDGSTTPAAGQMVFHSRSSHSAPSDAARTVATPFSVLSSSVDRDGELSNATQPGLIAADRSPVEEIRALLAPITHSTPPSTFAANSAANARDSPAHLQSWASNGAFTRTGSSPADSIRAMTQPDAPAVTTIAPPPPSMSVMRVEVEAATTEEDALMVEFKENFSPSGTPASQSPALTLGQVPTADREATLHDAAPCAV